MHPLEQRFAIVSVTGGKVKYINFHDLYTTDVEEAKQFSSLVEGRIFLAEFFRRKEIFAEEQESYSVIPIIEYVVKPHQLELPSLPPPDFYEVGEPTSAEFIISILSGDEFALGFTPVDNITGAGQMQAGIGTDAHDDRAVARMAKFSFPGWMEKDEIIKLHESATRHKKWKNCRIVNRGNGFAKWFIVVLSSEL